MLTADNIIDRVRRMLNQVPLAGEDVRTDSSVLASPSTQFSDENLYARINTAQRAIAGVVKAQHVPLLIRRMETPYTDAEVLRLLYSRVFHYGDGSEPELVDDLALVVEEAQAAPEPDPTPTPGRTIYSHTPSVMSYLTGNVLAVCGTLPAATQDLSIKIDGTTVGTINLKNDGNHIYDLDPMWLWPGQRITVVVDTAGTAANVTITIYVKYLAYADDHFLGVRCTQRSADRHRLMELSGRAASATYPAYTYEGGLLRVYPTTGGDDSFAYFVRAPTEVDALTDELDIDERLEFALVAHVVSSCYQTMLDTARAAAFLSLYVDEVTPFARGVRHGRIFDDREMDIEA